MNELEAIRNRHAVRNYSLKPIEEELIHNLQLEIDRCNREASLHLQLVTDNEDAFKSLIPAFGRFKGVKNYIALVASDNPDSYETCGYYGAKLAIMAQSEGLNTCFVTNSFRHNRCIVTMNLEEKLLGVIAIGYGNTQGTAHKSKALSELGTGTSDWFINGLKAAALAPTGLNKQNFFLKEQQDKVCATALNNKNITRMDLGIVKYHFEVGSGKDSSIWSQP